MKFITVRDLRNKPAEIWRLLPGEKEMVLTLNGKPIAILASTSGNILEETLVALRRARAMAAVAYMQERSAELGADRISLAEIDKEISSERKRRRSK